MLKVEMASGGVYDHQTLLQIRQLRWQNKTILKMEVLLKDGCAVLLKDGCAVGRQPFGPCALDARRLILVCDVKVTDLTGDDWWCVPSEATWDEN